MGRPIPHQLKPGRSAVRGALAALRALLAITIVAWLAHRIWSDRKSILALSVRGSYLDVGGALVFSLAGLLGLPLGFVLLLKRARLYRPAYGLFYLRLWLQSYFFRYVPGKVMLVEERVRLGRLVGIGSALSVVLLLWESVLLMAGACLVAVATLAKTGSAGGSTLPYLQATTLTSALLLAVLPWLVARLGRSAWWQRRFGGAVELPLGHLTQGLLTLAYALCWATLGAGFFCLCRWFVPLSLPALPRVVFAFVTGYVAGQVTGLIPGGVGVREGVMALGLAAVVEPGQAVALAVAERVWMTLIELFTVAVVARWVRMPPPPLRPLPSCRQAVSSTAGACLDDAG